MEENDREKIENQPNRLSSHAQAHACIVLALKALGIIAPEAIISTREEAPDRRWLSRDHEPETEHRNSSRFLRPRRSYQTHSKPHDPNIERTRGSVLFFQVYNRMLSNQGRIQGGTWVMSDPLLRAWGATELPRDTTYLLGAPQACPKKIEKQIKIKIKLKIGHHRNKVAKSVEFFLILGIGGGTTAIHDPPLGVFLDPPLFLIEAICSIAHSPIASSSFRY